VTHNVVVDFSESFKSVVVFLFGTIGSVVLSNEVNELSLGISDLGSEEGLSLRGIGVQVQDG